MTVKRRRQQARTKCKFCDHLISRGQLRIHERLCETRTEDERIVQWLKIEQQRKSHQARIRAEQNGTPIAVSTPMSEVLRLANKIAMLDPADRRAMESLIDLTIDVKPKEV